MPEQDHTANFAMEAASKLAIDEMNQSQSENSGVSAEMPRYVCHKKVHAFKIKSITFDRDIAQQSGRETDGSAVITPEEKGYAPFLVKGDYVHKHKPEAGGYYVVYEDGYKSFSPAKAFEDGYTRI